MSQPTELRWTTGPGKVWCATATLRAFGIFPEVDRPLNGFEMHDALHNGGWSYSVMPENISHTGRRQARYGTVAAFAKAHPVGDYYICTNGHAMALRDGLLTDTAQGGFDRRWVTSAYAMRPRSTEENAA